MTKLSDCCPLHGKASCGVIHPPCCMQCPNLSNWLHKDDPKPDLEQGGEAGILQENQRIPCNLCGCHTFGVVKKGEHCWMCKPSPSDPVEDEISQCPSCLCMTKTIDGVCGKCKADKDSKPVVRGKRTPEPQGAPSEEWGDKVKIILTEWLHRMDKLGELKDFVNRKAGFWVFECPELIPLIHSVREEAVREERERIKKAIDTKYPPDAFLNEVSYDEMVAVRGAMEETYMRRATEEENRWIDWILALLEKKGGE